MQPHIYHNTEGLNQDPFCCTSCTSQTLALEGGDDGVWKQFFSKQLKTHARIGIYMVGFLPKKHLEMAVWMGVCDAHWCE